MMAIESEVNLSQLACAAWKIQKKRGSRKRRYNPEDDQTVDTTQEERIDCVKKSEDNNRDSRMTKSLKDSIHHISRGDAGSTDAAIPARKSTKESEKSSSMDEGVSSSNPHKMLDFDLKFESAINLFELACAAWKIQKKRGSRKRRRYNFKDKETADTTQEEEIDCEKNSEDNNRDSSMTENLKDSVHQISRGDARSTDAVISTGKSTEESEKSYSTDECVSSSNPRKMLDFDLNELPPLEDEE